MKDNNSTFYYFPFCEKKVYNGNRIRFIKMVLREVSNKKRNENFRKTKANVIKEATKIILLFCPTPDFRVEPILQNSQ